MKKRFLFRLCTSLVSLLLISFTSFGHDVHGIALMDYARKHPLKIYTVTVSQKKEGIPIAETDQTNNFAIGNKILPLSDKGLKDIRGISKLIVEYNGQETPITEVPDLQIFLNRNEISEIPKELSQLDNVIFIYLNENRFKEVAPYIAGMESLLGMYFSGNDISTVPPEIFGMKQLKKLEFANNRIEQLPEELGNLTKLYHLKFCGNKLRTLPESMGNLTSLRVVDFSDNYLTSVPESLADVFIFYVLRLNGNRDLATLPTGPGFAAMPARIENQGTAIDPGRLPPEIRERTEADDPRYENGVKTYRIERTSSGEIIKTRL